MYPMYIRLINITELSGRDFSFLNFSSIIINREYIINLYWNWLKIKGEI